jgi:hypothetical protein
MWGADAYELIYLGTPYLRALRYHVTIYARDVRLRSLLYISERGLYVLLQGLPALKAVASSVSII